MIIHCATLTAYRPCSGGKGGGNAQAVAAADTGAGGDPAAGDTDAAAATETGASAVVAGQDAEAAVGEGALDKEHRNERWMRGNSTGQFRGLDERCNYDRWQQQTNAV